MNNKRKQIEPDNFDNDIIEIESKKSRISTSEHLHDLLKRLIDFNQKLYEDITKVTETNKQLSQDVEMLKKSYENVSNRYIRKY